MSQTTPATKNTAPKMLTFDRVLVLWWKICDIQSKRNMRGSGDESRRKPTPASSSASTKATAHAAPLDHDLGHRSRDSPKRRQPHAAASALLGSADSRVGPSVARPTTSRLADGSQLARFVASAGISPRRARRTRQNLAGVLRPDP